MGLMRTFPIPALFGAAATAALLAISPAIIGNGHALAQTISPQSTLEINVNSGELLRLPRPASKVFVADPAIADFQAASSSSLLISKSNLRGFPHSLTYSTLQHNDKREQLILTIDPQYNQ